MCIKRCTAVPSVTLQRKRGKTHVCHSENWRQAVQGIRGDVIYVEKLGVEDGATVSFDEVLVVGEGDSITVGAPYVSGAVVTGTVEKTGKGKKINIFKMKPKKGYRRRQGHRQPYTKVTIASIKA